MLSRPRMGASKGWGGAGTCCDSPFSRLARRMTWRLAPTSPHAPQSRPEANRCSPQTTVSGACRPTAAPWHARARSAGSANARTHARSSGDRGRNQAIRRAGSVDKWRMTKTCPADAHSMPRPVLDLELGFFAVFLLARLLMSVLRFPSCWPASACPMSLTPRSACRAAFPSDIGTRTRLPAQA